MTKSKMLIVVALTLGLLGTGTGVVAHRLTAERRGRRTAGRTASGKERH